MSTAWPTATAHRHRGLSHRATLSTSLAARAAAVAAVTGSGSSWRGAGAAAANAALRAQTGDCGRVWPTVPTVRICGGCVLCVNSYQVIPILRWL